MLPGLNIPIIRKETACASSSMALNQAVNCLSKYSNVMIIGVKNMTGTKIIHPTYAITMASDTDIDYRNGLIFPASYALTTQQYMNKYGIGMRSTWNSCHLP